MSKGNVRRARRDRWVRSIALALALMSPVTFAADKAGVHMADTLHVRDQDLVLNGLGLREATVFKVDVYVAGLYVTQKTSDPAAILQPDKAKAMHLVFVHDVDREKISDAWTEGFEKNAGSKLGAMHQRVELLKSWMVDLKKGSTLTFAYVPEQGIEVSVNGISKGVLPGPEFAQVFFSIWLGPKPPNDDLKTGLLGR
jgi:hypothetical protein